MLPLLTVAATPARARAGAAVVVTLIALALLGDVGARLGGARRRAMVGRVLAPGAASTATTRSSAPSSDTRQYARLAMLIDRLMPEFDATRIEHRVVAGRIGEAYAAAVGIDFVDAVQREPRAAGLLGAARPDGAGRVRARTVGFGGRGERAGGLAAR